MDTTNILKQLIKLDDDRTQGRPAGREQMLIAAQALVASLQTPSELISSVGWAEPARFACMRTAVDLNIFEILTQAGSQGAKIDEVTKVTGAEEGLIARILRHLAAMNIIRELSEGVDTNTTVSSQLTESKYRDGILYCYDVAGPSFRSMPTYFSQTEYKQPLDPTSGPFQHAHDTKSHFFSWLASDPTYLTAFSNYMSGYREGKEPWFSKDFYPVRKNLVDGFQPNPLAETAEGNSKEPVFLVDIGGGTGHDVLALSSYFPDLPGTLILQDRPEVISSIPESSIIFTPSTSSSSSNNNNTTTNEKPTSKIHAQAHDFFTPQPPSTQHARAYFLHSVLHDWDDESCVKILETLKSALLPGYSRVLVHELIVPDTGSAWSVTGMDWLMMALGSVKERTEREFRHLFDRAGLDIVRVWTFEQGTEAVIEAVLRESAQGSS